MKPSLWSSQRYETVAIVIAFAVLLVGVAVLFELYMARRRSERTLASRLAFERLVSELAAVLIDVDPAKADQAIERALKKVLEAMDLDKCSLFVARETDGEIRATHQATFLGESTAGRSITVPDAPGVRERLRKGETVHLVDERSGASVADTGAYLRNPFQHLLMIPVSASDRLVRGIAFRSRGGQRWAGDLVPRLKLVGEILVAVAVGKRAQAALRDSESRYREVVESQTDLICRFRPDTTLTFVNEAYCRFFGKVREDLVGRTFLDLMPESVREAVRLHIVSLVENPRLEWNEHEVLRPDGTIAWQQWHNYAIHGRDGRVIEFQGIGRDITDRKRAEEVDRQLRRAGRLSLLGELTASIAHEINQPLGAILSNADALEMLLESGHAEPQEVAAILSDIRRDGVRASEVIRHVRSLVEKRAVEMHLLDLNDVARDAIRLAAAECQRRGVALKTELACPLPAVRGDRVGLQQVLLNLLVNAMDAMVETPADARRLLLRTGPNEGASVELEVVDRGHGVPADLLPRLFDSFVTTREHGMGLGLSVSRTIVEAHGGRIGVENNPGGGATVRVVLPASGGAEEPAIA
jgi:PAS domain S-box-containing protein